MSQTAVVLVVLAVLLSAVQWAWCRVAAHLDLFLMPAGSRRHVQKVLANATHIHLTAVVLVALGVCVQVVSFAG